MSASPPLGATSGVPDRGVAPRGPRPTRWFRRVGPWLLGSILLAVGVWTVRDLVGDAVRSLRAARIAWLVPAAVTELLVYAAHAGLIARVFRPLRRLGPVTSLQTALVVFGLGGIMPASPAEGVTAASAELGHRGVDAVTAAKALVVVEWERFLAITVLIAIDLVVAVANGRPLGLDVVEAVGVSAAVLLALGAVAAAVQGRGGAAVATAIGRRWRRTRLHRSRPRRSAPPTVRHLIGSRGDRLAMLLLASAGWLGEAVVLLLCLRAVGVRLDLDAVLLAEAIGAAASLIPFLPGGFGAIDVAVPATLHLCGVPLADAVAATVVWRGITLLAPAAAGGITIAQMRRRDIRP